MKKNCWEIKHCGRELNGDRLKDFGVCPVAMTTKLDGVHGGNNAGRCCWVVAGTYCNGKPQGLFVDKFSTCEQCEVYKLVKKEEYPHFSLANILLKKLREED